MDLTLILGSGKMQEHSPHGNNAFAFLRNADRLESSNVPSIHYKIQYSYLNKQTRVDNYSIPGLLAKDLSVYWNTKDNPTTIIISCGNNDIQKSVKPEKIFGNIKNYITVLKIMYPECNFFLIPIQKSTNRLFDTDVDNLNFKLSYIENINLLDVGRNTRDPIGGVCIFTELDLKN